MEISIFQTWTGSRAQPAGELEACWRQPATACWKQLVKFPTHLKGNILDLVLTNIPERVTEVEDVGMLGTSDHIAMLTKVNTGPRRKDNVL